MSWRAWELDTITWGWIAWIGWFLALESYALWASSGQELTAHLRPVFGTHSLAWFLAAGAWLWLGVHILAPRLEAWVLATVDGGGAL